MLQDTGGAKPQQEGERKPKIDFRGMGDFPLDTGTASWYYDSVLMV